jgi:hypothetical protein
MKLDKGTLAAIVVIPAMYVVAAIVWTGYFILSRLGVVERFKD